MPKAITFDQLYRHHMRILLDFNVLDSSTDMLVPLVIRAEAQIQEEGSPTDPRPDELRPVRIRSSVGTQRSVPLTTQEIYQLIDSGPATDLNVIIRGVIRELVLAALDEDPST
jgi:hypothetical protein